MPELGTFNHDNLIVGRGFPIATGEETITGGAFNRGTVLGRITASGKLKAVDSAQTDGSEQPYAILVEDVDASGGDVVAPVYYTGEFNERKLVFGGTDTADIHRAALRKIGIFLKNTVRE